MIAIVVACCKSFAIGKGGNLLHHIHEDLIFFKNLTLTHSVIVGKTTYESIPNRLEGRRVIVVSADKKYKCPIRGDIIVVNSIPDAMSALGKDGFIVGGATIYKQTLQFTDRIYMTQINDYCVGDVYFPSIDFAQWNTISQQTMTDGHLEYSRMVLDRREH